MTAVSTVTQKRNGVYGNTNIGETTENSSGYGDTDPKEIDCEDLKDSAGAIEACSGQSNTEKQTVEYEVLTQNTHYRRQQRTH